MVTMLICISARFRQAQIVGASPFGIKIRTEEDVMVGEPVMLTHVDLDPITGRISWAQDSFSRVEFSTPLSPAAFASWFNGLG